VLRLKPVCLITSGKRMMVSDFCCIAISYKGIALACRCGNNKHDRAVNKFREMLSDYFTRPFMNAVMFLWGN
jgi:hypothetical protein